MNEEQSKEAIRRLKIEQKNVDTEDAHKRADEIILHLLVKLGYEDVVSEFNRVEKWYA